jgi:hypothetical protein
VTLIADEGAHRAGEPFSLRYRVKNSGPKPVWIVDGGDYRNKMGRPESYKLTARLGPEQIPVEDVGISMGGMMGPHPVAPNESYEMRLLVPRWLVLKKAGHYVFSVEKKLRTGAGKTDGWDEKNLDELPTHVSLSLDVDASTPESMGALIDVLGAKMMLQTQDGYDAANTLDFVDDPRAIAKYAAVVNAWKDGNDATFSTVLESTYALRKWSTAEARAPLVRALSFKNESIRLAAAQSLSAQKTPEAFAALWALRTDKSDSVRLTVLQAADKLGGPDVATRLRFFLKDASPMVATEAKRLYDPH